MKSPWIGRVTLRAGETWITYTARVSLVAGPLVEGPYAAFDARGRPLPWVWSLPRSVDALRALEGSLLWTPATAHELRRLYPRRVWPLFQGAYRLRWARWFHYSFFRYRQGTVQFHGCYERVRVR